MDQPRGPSSHVCHLSWSGRNSAHHPGRSPHGVPSFSSLRQDYMALNLKKAKMGAAKPVRSQHKARATGYHLFHVLLVQTGQRVRPDSRKEEMDRHLDEKSCMYIVGWENLTGARFFADNLQQKAMIPCTFVCKDIIFSQIHICSANLYTLCP